MSYPFLGLLLLTCLAACQSVPAGESGSAANDASVQAAVPGDSRGDAEPHRALAFAQGACGGCHAVEHPGLSPNPEAPPFAAIVNREGLTKETLTTWLRDAHNYPEEMDFDLDPPQVDALVDYMLTLQVEDYRPTIG